MARSQIRSGAMLSYISILLGCIISISYTPVMLRLLGQSEYGLMSLAQSVVGYLSILNLGLGSAMVRYLSKYRGTGDSEMVNALMTLFLKVFSIIAVLILIGGTVMVFNVDSLFGNKLTTVELYKLRILTAIMAFAMAIGVISSVFRAVMMAYEKFVLTTTVGIISTILTPIVMLIILYGGYKSVAMVFASFVLGTINTLFYVLYIFKFLKLRFRTQKFEKSFLKELFGFSFFVFFAMIVDKIYWGTDQFILGAVAGTTAVAVYSIGSSFTTYFMSFSTAISGLFLPRLSAMTANNVPQSEYNDLFIRVGRVQFLILGFILGGFITLGQEFICLWAGPEYNVSYFIALVILVPFTIPLIQNIGLQLLYARNKHKFRSILLFVIALLNVVVSIPLAKHYGGLGCAAVTGVSFIIGQVVILNWYYYKKMHLDIPGFWKGMVKLTLALFMILACGFVLFHYFVCNNWLKWAVGGVIFTCLYWSIMWLTVMNSYEKEMIKSYIPFLKKNKVDVESLTSGQKSSDESLHDAQ